MTKRRRALENLDREIHDHIEAETLNNIGRGMPPEEARHAALRTFGNITSIKEDTRAVWIPGWADQLLRDITYGLRTMRRSPGFAVAAVLTLALGVGANTAIFTVTYATLLAPLPYPHPDQLVMVWSKIQGHRNLVSAGDFTDWKSQSTLFEDLNAWDTPDFNIAARDRPESIEGMAATYGYNRMLGNPLILGRNFLPEEGEPGHEHVVILTHRLWQRLGGNPKVIGQTMRINSELYTVVGVFAPGTADRWDEELMVPLVFKPEQQIDRGSRYWLVAGRLKPGVTIQQAQGEMDAITAREAKDHPKSNQDWGAQVEPLKNDFLPSNRRSTLWLLLGSVGLLLLVACLNVANLLVAKGLTRQREVAIRGSLGAKPAAIFAQFLTESLMFAVLGGMLGIAAGYAMLQGLVAAIPLRSLPAEADLRLNVSVVLIMLSAAALAGVFFGCAPAWYASRLAPAEILKEGGRSGISVGRHRLRRVLVITEFALALSLLVGAGLAIHSFWNLTHVPLGVRTDHILSFYLDPPSLLKDPNRINSYYRNILASIETVPGVAQVSAMSYLPLDSLHAETPFAIAGDPAFSDPSQRPNADLAMVTPGYFQTFGIQIVKGRVFTDADNASSVRVAMVNDTFASRFLKGIDPLHQSVLMKQVIPGEPKDGPPVEWQIVGIFHTVKSRGSREDHPEIDTPFWQEAFPISGIGVRTAENPATMIKSIAGAVNAVDPQAALYLPRTMEQVHDEVLANDRFMTVLFASFAALALLLATVGIYGVMALSAAQRSHEIAVRMALGATRNRVVALVIKEGVVLACIGLGFGLIGAYLVERAMQSILFGVGAIDFLAIGIVGLLLLLAALLASYLPALKATSAETMQLLKTE